MAGIRDVARRARVHISTVSRALSKPESVAPETRERVLRAVEALNYVPNTVASNLRRQRGNKILVITPDLTNALFPMVLTGIEAAANEAGYAVLLGYTAWGDRQREQRYATMMANREADGLIFLSPEIPEAARRLMTGATRKRPAPVVNVLSCDPAARIPMVHIDNDEAAYQAIDYLISLGHERIGMITGPRGTTVVEARMHGATRRARQAGRRCHLSFTAGPLSIEGGRAAANELLASTKVTAIFTTKDEMAIGALQIAGSRGLQVPRDLSLIGFDGIGMTQFTQPALTTVAQPFGEIGRAAVRLLLEVVERHRRPEPSLVLPHELIVRASTAPPARALQG